MNENHIKFKFILNLLICILPISLIAGSFLSNLVVILISIMFIYYSYIEKFWFWIKSRNFIILAILFIYLILNSFLSLDIISSLTRSAGYVKFFIFFISLKYFYEKNLIELKKISIVWIITISILSFDILFQGYFGKNIIGYETSNPFRNSSFFFDELKAAALLVGFTFLSLSIFINNSSKEKIIYLIFIICLACLVTGERANFIRYFLLFLGFIFICRKKYNLLNILIITSIALIPLITIYKNDIIERNARSLHWLENGEHDLNFKKKYLKSHYGIHAITAYEIFQDNIFIGVGNKNFRNICKNYQDKISNKYNVQPIGCSTHPHQIWYELLTEHGIFGTLLICICLILIIINRFKERNINLINLMSLLYLLSVFIPILPSGSFFNSYNSTMFWTNLAFFVISFRKS